MKRYTLGYIFTADLKKVLLVHKLAPEWQLGKLNAVGGKIEEGEESIDCIVREVEEETTLKTNKKAWRYLGEMHGEPWRMEIFTYVYQKSLYDAKKAGKEEIQWFDINNLPENIIPNLRWQIPLALEKIQYNALKSFSMEYDETIG
jgi:8-oxo-dGTP diphosphatase